MENYLYRGIIRKIEYYLYNYDLIDFKIDLLKTDVDNYEYKQTYSVWIKNRSSSLEDEVIRNIGNEQRILKIKKWKKLISEVLEDYKMKDKTKYRFICLKYFRKLKSIKIQDKLNLSYKEQIDMQMEIINHIFVVAIKKNMLKEVQI